METIGFIGLGNMGAGMAGNIQKAGYSMVVHDLREGATRPFLERGLGSPTPLPMWLDAAIWCLPLCPGHGRWKRLQSAMMES